MGSSHLAILQTLIYSNIFSFPLTKEELWRFLITSQPITRDAFQKALQDLEKVLVKKENWYALAYEGFAERKEGLKYVKKKQQRIGQAVSWLSKIPTIKLLALSGSLAAGVVKKDDDIDIFIVSTHGTVWLTRLATFLVLEFSGARRARLEKSAKNKICVNMILDESVVAFPSDRRDVYTARELAQLQVLYQKDRMFNRLIAANPWVYRLLPNAFPALKKSKTISQTTGFLFLIRPFELIAYLGQYLYLKRHITVETVTAQFIAFHPKDYRVYVMKLYKNRVHQLTDFAKNRKKQRKNEIMSWRYTRAV